MKLLIFYLGCVSAIAFGAELPGPESPGTAAPPTSHVVVCLEDRVRLAPDLLQESLETATQIFSAIQVEVHWQCGRNVLVLNNIPSEAIRESVVVRLQDNTPSYFLPGAIAYARPFAHEGVRVTVFYDRFELIREHHAHGAGSILGHTIAHEIAHVLAGEDAHSPKGLMQSRWSERDFNSMETGLLGFTPDDVRFIQRNLAAHSHGL